MIYVNGEGFSAASCSASNFEYAAQDPKYFLLSTLPHPKNFDASYAKILSNALHQSLRNDSYIGNSWRKIVREIFQMIEKNKVNYIVISWPDFYRGEVIYNNKVQPFYFNDVDNENTPSDLKKLIFNYFENFKMEEEQKDFIEAVSKLSKYLELNKIYHTFMMSNSTIAESIVTDTDVWLFNPSNNTIKQWAIDNNLLNELQFLTEQGHKELGKIVLTHLTNQL